MVEYTQTRIGPGSVLFESIPEGRLPYICEVSALGYKTNAFTVEVVEGVTQSYSTTLTPKPALMKWLPIPLMLLSLGAIFLLKEGVK